MPKALKLIVSLAISFAAGAIGSLATIPNISAWYAYLDKPFFSPPNWLFGPVWTVLYLLMGISLYIVWTRPYSRAKRGAILWFGVQLVLNTLWSIAFFGLHAPKLGVAVIILLLISIALTIGAFWRVARHAAYLLIPYLAWVSFATALNIGVALLN